MGEYPLVTIMTPCYNGETYVHRFFESVLKQTYPNLELIFVNDGSKDRTEEIALGYTQALKEKGIQYQYIYQENGGQASAINQALKIFRGEYLTWPDSDDWMSDDCIEKKVAYLQAHPEKGYVMCKTAKVPENDLQKTIGISARRNTANGWLFEDLIFENDIYFAPGGYMVRSKEFLDALPSRHIYECKTGQNWQLLLPIAYKYECGFLDEVLYYYLVRSNSHSRAEKNFRQLYEKTYRHQDTLEQVVASIEMPEEEKQQYLKRIRIKYHRIRLHLARTAEEYDIVQEQYAALCKEDAPGMMARLDYLRAKYPVVEGVIRIARIPWRLIVKLRGY